jgi:hypothetical protein
VVDFQFLKRLVSGLRCLTLFEEAEPVGFQIDRLKESEVDLVMGFIDSLHMLAGCGEKSSRATSLRPPTSSPQLSTGSPMKVCGFLEAAHRRVLRMELRIQHDVKSGEIGHCRGQIIRDQFNLNP